MCYSDSINFKDLIIKMQFSLILDEGGWWITLRFTDEDSQVEIVILGVYVRDKVPGGFGDTSCPIFWCLADFQLISRRAVDG